MPRGVGSNVSAASLSASEIFAPSTPFESSKRDRTFRKPSWAFGLSLSVRAPCQTVLSLSCRCSSWPRVCLPSRMSRFSFSSCWSPLFGPLLAPPKTIAPILPFPIGSACVHTGAGFVYHSLRSACWAAHRMGAETRRATSFGNARCPQPSELARAVTLLEFDTCQVFLHEFRFLTLWAERLLVNCQRLLQQSDACGRLPGIVHQHAQVGQVSGCLRPIRTIQ